MDHPAIFSATLGLSHPWHITAVSIAKEERRMDITVDFSPGSTFVCPICGERRNCCRRQTETWYHSDFFRYSTYLHASVPHINCCCGDIPAMERPWSRAGSRFTLVAREES